MKKENVFQDAFNLLNTYNENGLFVAVDDGDGNMSVVCKTNEGFSMGMISVLAKSVLNENSCCQAHFMQASLELNQMLKDLVLEALPKVGEKGTIN
jgi:hypothetical protein